MGTHQAAEAAARGHHVRRPVRTPRVQAASRSPGTTPASAGQAPITPHSEAWTAGGVALGPPAMPAASSLSAAVRRVRMGTRASSAALARPEPVHGKRLDAIVLLVVRVR